MNRAKVLRNLRNKKIAIDDVVNSYSSRIHSHKSAWAYLLKSKLKFLGVEDVTVLDKNHNVHDFDVWLIALPMEFQGTFNVFGGANDELAERIQRLVDYEGTLYCLDQEMPDIGAFVESRKSACSDKFMELDHGLISEICETVDMLSLDLGSHGLVLGDSHSVSVYKPGYDIIRLDGQTLHGFMKKDGFWKYIPDHTTHLISYFGNIDIRHHLMRQPDPAKSVRNLCKTYAELLKEQDHLLSILVVGALPIENESRKLPKTGYYEGTPFAGSWNDRDQLRRVFNTEMRSHCYNNGWEFMAWPKGFLNSSAELDFEYMEKPKSVHLSRQYYMYDFETNKENEFFNQLYNVKN